MNLNIDCPICYECLNIQTNYVKTECGHAFHCSCLMKHTSLNGFNCPYCRNQTTEPVVDDEDEDENETYLDSDNDFETETDNNNNVKYDFDYIAEHCGPKNCALCIEINNNQSLIDCRYCSKIKENATLLAFKDFNKFINNEYNQDEEYDDEDEEGIVYRIPIFEEYKNYIINQLGYTLDDLLKISLIDYFYHYTTLRLQNIPESITNTNYTMDSLFENIEEYTENYNNNR